MATCQNVLFDEYQAPQKAWAEVRVYAHAGRLSVFFPDISTRREAEAAARDGFCFYEPRMSAETRDKVTIFDAGYSTLAHLRRFPVDILKLDRSFLYQQDGCIGSFYLVKAFIDMAHALGSAVVAEGVEDNEAVRFLRESTCDEAQGYLREATFPGEIRGVPVASAALRHNSRP